jgi:hypothetical protein
MFSSSGNGGSSGTSENNFSQKQKLKLKICWQSHSYLKIAEG